MLKAGVVGIGKMGISHAAILGAHPDVENVYIADTSKFLLSAFNKYSKFITYTDYRKMIDENDLNCIVISTPSKFHYEMVIYALDKNLHVFCEKPLSLSLDESEKMTNFANQNGLINQVGFHNRFIGTFQALKRFVDQGLIGRVLNIRGETYGPVVTSKNTDTWRSDPKEGGGCLYDYASHVINLMQFIVGSPSKVAGTILKKIYSKKVEDAVYSNFFYENGLTGQLIANWSEETYRKMSTKIEVFGEKGKIICDAQECQLYLKENPKIEGFKKGWNSFWITDQTKPVWFNLRGEEYSAQLDYFINCIKNKRLDNINSFSSAFETDKVINMLRKDAEDK